MEFVRQRGRRHIRQELDRIHEQLWRLPEKAATQETLSNIFKN